MDIKTKLVYIKTHIHSLASHDDASEDDVRATLTEAKSFIQDELDTLTLKRTERQTPAAEGNA